MDALSKEGLQIHPYTFSSELFEKGFTSSTGPCRCTSVCCEGGVYADVREKENILDHKDMIRKYMDETQTTDETLWFEDRDFDDADFPSGRCVGTREINDKCAFLDKIGRCTLQVAATGEGMDRWTLKPLFCILYPIEISNNVVSFDDMLQNEQPCCSISSDFQIPLFEACRAELVHLVGEDSFRIMREHFMANRSTPLSEVTTTE